MKPANQAAQRAPSVTEEPPNDEERDHHEQSLDRVDQGLIHHATARYNTAPHVSTTMIETAVI